MCQFPLSRQVLLITVCDIMIHGDSWLEEESMLSAEEQKILYIFKILKSWLESAFNTLALLFISASLLPDSTDLMDFQFLQHFMKNSGKK